MDQPQYTVRLTDGREFGPAGLDVIGQWARERRVPPDATLVSIADGSLRSVLAEPALQHILHAPPMVATSVPQPEPAGALSGLIPYKNPAALTGYYISIASLFPILGAIAGPVAITLGIIGMRRRLQKPEMRGLAHAWIAIILGAIGTLISIGCFASIIFGNLNR